MGCQGSMTKVDSWWRWLFWHCSYCFCICDSSDYNSDRYFSLKPSVSNIDNNKYVDQHFLLTFFCQQFYYLLLFGRVVTGLRFTKVKQMFHLQVEEGHLGPRGLITEHSRHWVEVPGSEFSYKNKTLKENIDYHTLTYTARAIDLDNVIAPANTIITGRTLFFS